MITDDQVAALLRDAGTAGPLPRPLDPSDAAARAGRGRTRTEALSGLAVALAAVLVLTEPGRVVLTTATVGATAPVSPGWSPEYLPPVLLLLVLLASALATPLALRLRVDAVPRRLLAAVWGVVAILVVGLFSSEWGVFLVPSRWELLRGTRFFQPWPWLVLLVPPVVVAAGALLGRRALRPSSIRPVSGALWLSVCLMCGWALASLAFQPVSDPAPGSTPLAVVALAAALAVTVGLGAAARRRLPPGSPWRLSSGATLLVVAVSAATSLGIEVPQVLNLVTRRPHAGVVTWLVVVTAVLICLALVGARLALHPQRRTWLSAVLAVAVVPLSVQSGQSLMSAMQSDVRTGAVHPAPGLLWAGLLAVLAVAALVAVDRRTSSPAVVDGSGADSTARPADDLDA